MILTLCFLQCACNCWSLRFLQFPDWRKFTRSCSGVELKRVINPIREVPELSKQDRFYLVGFVCQRLEEKTHASSKFYYFPEHKHIFRWICVQPQTFFQKTKAADTGKGGNVPIWLAGRSTKKLTHFSRKMKKRLVTKSSTGRIQMSAW